jgi:hypothetical protein
MGLTVAGLFIDPDKTFVDTKKPEWAANNIFLFGALALATISANALLTDKARAKA